MSIDNGDFMVSIIQLGDKGETDIHLDFSDKLTKSKLLYSIDTLRQQGADQKFDVRAFETAGYEVSFEKACVCFDQWRIRPCHVWGREINPTPTRGSPWPSKIVWR